jgi:hypothetical protein
MSDKIVDLAEWRLLRDETNTIHKLEKLASKLLAVACDSMAAGNTWLAERCATAAIDCLRPTLPQFVKAPEEGGGGEEPCHRLLSHRDPLTHPGKAITWTDKLTL